MVKRHFVFFIFVMGIGSVILAGPPKIVVFARDGPPDEASYKVFVSLAPKQYAPQPHLPSMTAGLHLNYEQLPDDTFETILRQALGFSDGFVVYYCQDHREQHITKTVELFKKYGFHVVWRLDLKVPGPAIEHFKDQYPAWYHGTSGKAPGLGDGVDSVLDDTPVYPPRWREPLSLFFKDTLIAYKSVAPVFVEQGWGIQFFNEPNLTVEWEQPAPPGMLCGEVVCPDKYRLLGHYVCSISAFGAGYLTSLRGQAGVRYEHALYWNYPGVDRITIVIPDIADAPGADRQAYIEGCLDALNNIPSEASPRPPVHATYTVLRVVNVAYGAHIYPDCALDMRERIHYVRRNLEQIQQILNAYVSSRGFVAVIPVFVTEFGCAQLSTATRHVQYETYQEIRKHVRNIPFAWWVFAGRQCHDAKATISGRNTPEDWDKMAIVNYAGFLCEE